MHRAAVIVGISSALVVIAARDARACGGCFHPPPQPTQVASDITDERMLLAVSQTQTTLYDQIRYSGSPSSFAWVLPIKGTVTVGLSADVLFDSVDALTATQIEPPASSCPQPQCNNSGGGCMGAASTNDFASGNAGGGWPPPVTVTKQENVGPYATVQLHSKDSSALAAWLGGNGFVIPADVTPVLEAYVNEGFDFLALKLLPNQGVQAMRPVRVTSPGAGFSLPLRMAAIGTGATVGITIWVVSDGRYEPQNFPFFHIDDAALVWDWKTSLSNYTSVRAGIEAASSYRAWEIESSIDINEQRITTAIVSGGANINGYGPTVGDPSQDYLPVTGPATAAPDGGDAATPSTVDDASADDGSADGAAADDAGADDAAAADGDTGDGGAGEAAEGGGGTISAGDAGGSAPASDAGTQILMTAEQVRTADIATLFAGLPGPNVRITRIRSDIAHTAMTADLVLQASADQTELTNVRYVKKSVNESCPIYDGCSVVGYGTPQQAAAKSKSGGCAATPGLVTSWSSASGVLAGLLGLALARAASRRRSPRTKG
jgi:hypothetical protein